MKFVLLALLLTIRSMEAAPAQRTNEQINWAAKGDILSRAGDYSGASAAFRQALDVDAANGIEDEQTIGVLAALAGAYGEMGQFANARREYHRALALAEKIDGWDILLRGLIIARTAAVPGDAPDDRTITELRQAIATTGQRASADQLAVMRVSLARILSERKTDQEAEKLLRDAVADLRKEKDPRPKRLLDSLNALGVLLLDQKRYTESNALFQEAIQVSQDALGAEHPILIPVLNNLATSYVKIGRPQEAAAVFERTIAIAGKTIGEENPNYGLLLGNYAVALKELGRKKEAKKLSARSQRIDSAFRRRNGLDSTIAIASLYTARSSDTPHEE